MIYCAVPRESYISHHGVKGQKWGIRRYQLKDGSYTPEGKKQKNKNAKTDRQLSKKSKTAIKVGAIVAGTALAAAGGYALYKSGKLTPLANSLSEKGKLTLASARNKGSNFSDVTKRKLSSLTTKYGMIGRMYAKQQLDVAKSAVKEGIKGYQEGLTKAALLGGTGILAKKLSDIKSKNGESIFTKAGDDAIAKAENSIRNGNKSSGTNNNSNKGGHVGKNLSQKLGSPTQEHYSPQDETRYQQVFKNDKVKNNVETRQTIKSLRREGYNVSQIEKYLEMI